jgi:hypothetical protein
MLYVTPNWVGRSEYVWFQTLRSCEGGLACIPHPQPDLPPPTLQSHAAKSAREDKRPFGGEPVSPAVPCSYQKKNLTVVTGPQTNRLRRSAAHALIGLSQTGHPPSQVSTRWGCMHRASLSQTEGGEGQTSGRRRAWAAGREKTDALRCLAFDGRSYGLSSAPLRQISSSQMTTIQCNKSAFAINNEERR